MRHVVFALLFAAAPAACAAPASQPTLKKPHGAAVGLARRDRPGGKPSAPLQFGLIPGPISRDGSQVVRIVVTPLADGDRVEVEIDADRGLSRASGPAKWTGAAKRGRPVAQDIVLRSAYQGERRLVVTGTLVTGEEENGEQSGVAVFSVRPQAPMPTSVAHPGSRVVRGKNGKRILEIPAGTF